MRGKKCNKNGKDINRKILYHNVLVALQVVIKHHWSKGSALMMMRLHSNNDNHVVRMIFRGKDLPLTFDFLVLSKEKEEIKVEETNKEEDPLYLLTPFFIGFV